MRLTSHCRQRMAERNITLPTLEAVIEHGEVEPAAEDGLYKHTLFTWSAISAENGNVLTVWDKEEFER